MRGIQRKICLAAILMLTTVCLHGCSGKEIAKNPEFPDTLKTVATQTITSTDQLILKWDSEKSCVLLEQKKTEKIWSTIPYDFYQGTETDEDMNSPVYIQYVDSTSMLSVTDKGYADCVSMGRVAAQQIENGIKITYYFDNAKISVPITYTLREDALVVSVDFSNVQEGVNKLLSVSVAPFLCSTRNDAEYAYLVVPSGSGALMYTDEREEGIRTWQGEIYGEDPSRLLPENLTENEQVRLPFFGVKDGNDALLAIVETGDEAAFLTANAGNNGNGHSNAYVNFYARGFDILESQTAWAMSDVYRIEETIQVKESTVAFYPMAGEDADYVGMARRYQQYLKEQGFLDEQVEEQQFALYITGGAQIKELIAGIPIKKTKALTTFEQVQKIIEETVAQTNEMPAVQLKGFGKTGLDAGKVAGGFEFASAFGSEKQRKSLETYCGKNQIPLFTDLDLVYFKNSGEGLNTLLDAAKSASSHKVQIFQKDKALWHYDEDEKGSYLVGRAHLQSLTEQLMQAAGKKGISGISLATLGKIAYSDYSDATYSARGNTVTDVQNTLSQLSNQGMEVATESANAYAAAVSDSIFSVPVNDGAYIDLDEYIPLYQIVFKGYAALYSTAVNTTENYKKSVAQAVAGGTSLGFAVVGEYDKEFANTIYTDLYACAYAGNKKAMTKVIMQCADYYTAIQGQTITDYEYISDTVSKTSFSNGVVVYTNHSDEVASSPLGELEAYGFSYTSEGN